MNNFDITYAAVQNGVVIAMCETREEAEAVIKEEKAKDFVSIVLRKKLRKLFKKTGNIALHTYEIFTVAERIDLTK